MILLSGMLSYLLLLLQMFLICGLLLLVFRDPLMYPLQLQLRLMHRVLLHLLQPVDPRRLLRDPILHLHELLGDASRIIRGGDRRAEGAVCLCRGREEGRLTYLFLSGVVGVGFIIRLGSSSEVELKLECGLLRFSMNTWKKLSVIHPIASHP